jgi:hypothetical protein
VDPVTGVRALQVLDVDYAIPAGDWATSGGSVVFLTGHLPVAGARVERRRITPPDQPVPFGDDATFRPVANEEAFDKTARLIQEERARTSRAFVAPVGETGFTLHPEALRDGRLPVFSGGGLGFLDTPERLVATDGDGKAYALPLVQALNAIGIPFTDYGLLTSGETDLDDYGALI